MLETCYVEKINLHLFDGRKKLSDIFPIGLEAKFKEMLKESLKSEALHEDNKDVQLNSGEADFTTQVDAVLNGTDTNSTHLKVMETPDLLQKAGLPNLPILMTAKHLKTITAANGKDKANYHNLSVEIVKKLPQYISEPVMIADSLTQDDSIVIITEAVDSNNRPVIAAILLNGYGQIDKKYIRANVMTSAYGKDNFQAFLNNIANKNATIYWNEKKSKEMSVNLGLQLPNIITRLRSNVIIRQAKALVNTQNKNISKNSGASLSYTPDEGIDNSNENDYNNYTSSDEYIREVTPTDRRFFPRKLANKTAFLEDGDIETVHLYCPEKVYTFVANGYMKGYISKSEKASKLEARKRRYEKYDGNRVNVHRTVIDVWSEPVPNQSRRPIDNVSDARGGRRPNADDILSKDTSGSARKGNYERVWENTYSQEEVNGIIRQLREMYGYANSESSLSYTPAIDEQELTRMARKK